MMSLTSSVGSESESVSNSVELQLSNSGVLNPIQSERNAEFFEIDDLANYSTLVDGQLPDVALAIVEDRGKIYAGLRDGGVGIFDEKFRTSEIIKDAHADAVPCVATNNYYFFSGSEDGVIKRWKKKTKEVLSLSAGAWVKKIEVDDKYLYALCGDRLIIWEGTITEFKKVKEIDSVQDFAVTHKANVTQLGKIRPREVSAVYIIRSAGKTPVRLDWKDWNNADLFMVELKPLDLPKDVKVSSLCYSETTKLLYFSSSTSSIYVWSEQNGLVGKIKGPIDAVCLRVFCWRHLLVSCTLKNVFIWFLNKEDNVDELATLHQRFDTPPITSNIPRFQSAAEYQRSEIASIYVGMDRLYKPSVFVGLTNGSIQAWRAIPASSVDVFRKAHAASVKVVRVDEKYYYSASADRVVVVWSKRTRTKVAELVGHTDIINNLIVDDYNLYSCSDDGTIIIWDKIALTKLHVLDGTAERKGKQYRNVKDICVDGARIYSLNESSNNVRVWNKNTGQPVADIEVADASSLESLHITDRFIYAADSSTIYPISTKIELPRDYNPTEVIHVKTKLELSVKVPQPLKISCLYTTDYRCYIGTSDGMIHAFTEKGGNWVFLYTINTTPHLSTTTGKPNDKSRPIDAIFSREVFKDNKLVTNRLFVGTGYQSDNDLKRRSHPDILVYHISKEDTAQPEAHLLYEPLRGHKGAVYSVCFDEGRVYSGGADQSIRIWDLESFYNLDQFQKKCMTIDKQFRIENYKDQLHTERYTYITPLMLAAKTGSITIAEQLLHEDALSQYGFEYVNPFGESAVFFALMNERWEFLRHFGWHGIQEVVWVDQHDQASYGLLTRKAAAGDIAFFKELKKMLIFDENEIARAAIEHNQHQFLKEFFAEFDVGSTYALHWACFYGHPDCVQALLELPNIQVNLIAKYFGNRTAIHICNFTAKEYSIYTPTAFHPYIPPPRSINLEDIPTDVFRQYDYQLCFNRLECFKRISEVTEVSKKPDLEHRDAYNMSPYLQALKFHKSAMEKMKIPRREMKDKEEIQKRNKLFASTADMLNYYHSDSHIYKFRNKFANAMFFLRTLLYVIYLIILTTVGLLETTNGKWYLFDLSQALQNRLATNNFLSVSNEADMWNWMQTDFMDAVYHDTPTNDTSVLLKYNLLIGAVQIRQLKVLPNTCDLRLYNKELTDCYVSTWTDSIQDKHSFGPNDTWEYTDAADDVYQYFAPDGNTYPSGGFVAELPANDSATAASTINYLKTNNWITKGTRVVFVTLTVYNANMNGAFVPIRITFFYGAGGDVVPDIDTSPLGAYTYDSNLQPGTLVKLIFQLFVALFVIYEYIAKEIYEIHQCVKEARFTSVNHNRKKQKFEVRSPIVKGILNYIVLPWNWYEWVIIIIFLFLVGLEITKISLVQQLNFALNNFKYFNMQPLAYFTGYAQDLLSLFILLNWIRVLKFLRLYTPTGPLVQSVIDTIKSRKVVVFIGLLVYIVLVQALIFHMAFGNDVKDYNYFGHSLITLVQVIFGQFDYESLTNSNPVFGPVFFVLFMFFIVFIMMNLLIGVLSEAYSTSAVINVARYNRYLTRFMLTEYFVQRSLSFEFTKLVKNGFKAFSFRNMLIALIPWIREEDEDNNDHLVSVVTSEPILKVFDEWDLDYYIWYTDDELDEMVARNTTVDILKLPKPSENPQTQAHLDKLEQMEQIIQQQQQRLEEMQKSHDSLHAQLKKMDNIEALLKQLVVRNN